MSDTRWRVRIPYREPTYEARRPAQANDGEPYVAQYEVSAPDAPTAIERALAAFDGDASESGVGWIREPVLDQIEATPA